MIGPFLSTSSVPPTRARRQVSRPVRPELSPFHPLAVPQTSQITGNRVLELKPPRVYTPCAWARALKPGYSAQAHYQVHPKASADGSHPTWASQSTGTACMHMHTRTRTHTCTHRHAHTHMGTHTCAHAHIARKQKEHRAAGRSQENHLPFPSLFSHLKPQGGETGRPFTYFLQKLK